MKDKLPIRSTTFQKIGFTSPRPGKPGLAHFTSFGISRRNHKRRMLQYATRIGAHRGFTFVKQAITHKRTILHIIGENSIHAAMITSNTITGSRFP